jgi:predicted metal-binding membrane protein
MRNVHEHVARGTIALRWRPEWRVAIFIALVWAALITGIGLHSHHSGSPGFESAIPGLHAHGYVLFCHLATGAAPTHAHSKAWSDVLGSLPGWTLMVIAMMAPATLPAVRHVGLNSIRRRRQWAMAIFLVVYFAVWVAFGGLVLIGDSVVRQVFAVEGRALLAPALGGAAVWQLTRPKRRALFRCRRTVPLPPVGVRADAACAHFALQQALRCVTSCWPSMTAMAVVSDHGLAWMAVFAVLIGGEELTSLGRRLLRPTAVALAFAALLVAFGI